MNELYLYFRTVDSAADDDQDVDSICFPLSSLTGFRPGRSDGKNLLTLKFKSVNTNMDNDGTGGAATDQIIVTLKAGSYATDLIEDLVQAFYTARNKQKKFLLIGDDVTSEYISSRIEAIGSITIVTRPS